ncbi:MAG: Fe-S cluster assembly protein HesB [Actinomycetota bacterium]|nr:Fe-S cluster assembly protein HesB [Actinomycetota bacterium]
MTAIELPLVGAGGESVDLERTLTSHGLAALPPLEPFPDAVAVRMTLPLRDGRPRTVEVREMKPGVVSVAIVGRAASAATRAEIELLVRRVLGLDQDLSGFYAMTRDDPDLAWVAQGAGRMLRSPTVFEDIVKTICTTNCAWSATIRMVSALVEHLGPRAAGAPASGWRGRAFPGPRAMMAAGEDFYRDVVRAGYRGRYFIALAETVAEGRVDPERWATTSPAGLTDDEVAAQLQQLPGVGPYAAAHIMMMLGRHSRLILDSWTRPTYARLTGRREVKDRTIERRFKRYGEYAGLAFWLFLTRGWVGSEPAAN